VCQLETLRRTAQRNLRGILEKLPRTLDETYERVLEEVSEDNREHARRLLHCIAVAIRPLRVEELAEILAFDFDDAEGGIPKLHASWRWKDQEEAVLFTCSSLIAVVDYHDSQGAHRVVQFSHFSVKEFLISDRLASSTGDLSRYRILPKPAHTILAQACLGSLLHLDEHSDEQSAKVSPLARYAAEHWVAHAQFEDVESRVKDGMLRLFHPDKPHLATWLNIYNIDLRSLLGSPPMDISNPLYYAALCGFRGLVEHLVTDYLQLVNAIGGCYESPLLAALSKRHIWIAEFLLQHGGEVDVRGLGGNTPLNNAVTMFEEHAVPFLLKHGADVNSQNDSLYTPLHYAASYTYLEASQMLLDRGADVNSRDDMGRTPLQWLFEDGPHIGSLAQVPHVARLLLERGANVNAQDDEHTLPLLQVLEPDEGSNLHLDDIAQMLLEYGAEPNVKNKNGKTPLQIVLGRKYYSKDHDAQDLVTARLLVEHGADVNPQDKDHTPPLLLAMQRNMYEMTRVLLSRGADPNVKNDNGKTAFFFFFEPILFWNTSPRLSPVVTMSRYIYEKLVNERWPPHSPINT
jgi:ankyrin repeat protein